MSVPGTSDLRFARYGSQRRSCGGAVAIEFALLFPIFFVVFYAIMAYGFALTIKQSVTIAAEEGARAAVQDALNEDARLNNAKKRAEDVMKWIPGNGVTVPLPTASDCSDDIPETRCVTVRVNYNHAAFPLVPSLSLLGFDIIIPDNLDATATVMYVQY